MFIIISIKLPTYLKQKIFSWFSITKASVSQFILDKEFSVPLFESIFEKKDIDSSLLFFSNEGFLVFSFESIIEMEDIILVKSSINRFLKILMDSLRFRLKKEGKDC